MVLPQVCRTSRIQLRADSAKDAKFEVIGSPFSLLSVSLSASQNLYTRKGSLVGVGGKVENVQNLIVKYLLQTLTMK